MSIVDTVLHKIFGTPHERKVKQLRPVIEQIHKAREALEALDDAETYGIVLRAKGIVQAEDGSWIHFDYVPGETNVRLGSAIVTGRLCVIGSQLKEEAIEQLFA